MSMLWFNRCRPCPEWLAFTRSRRRCLWAYRKGMPFPLWSVLPPGSVAFAALDLCRQATPAVRGLLSNQTTIAVERPQP